MEVPGLLALVFCVLAVALNAAACFVLLKRKTGKGAPAYSAAFAAFSFFFIIIGCIGFLFSSSPVVIPATLVLSGLCMLIHFATEKIPAQLGEGPYGAELPECGEADFGLSALGLDSPALQEPGGGYGDGLDGGDLDPFLPDPSSFLDGDDFSGSLSSGDLGFSAEDLDGLGLDLDLDGELDAEFSPVPEDGGWIEDSLLDGDFESELPPVPEDGGEIEDSLLDEDFESEFPQEDESPQPVGLDGALLEDDAAQALEGIAGSASLAEDEEDGILKAGQELAAKVSESISGAIGLDGLLDFANGALMEIAGADGGIVFLVDGPGGVLRARAFGGQFPPPYRLPDGVPHSRDAVQDSLRRAELPLEGNVFGEAALSGEAICIADGDADERVFGNGQEDFLKAGSYIIEPLSVQGKVVGVAGQARLSGAAPFSERDFRAAKSLAGYAAAAIGNVHSFQETMERAGLESGAGAVAEIQKAFLPKELPDLPEAGFGLFFQGARGSCSDSCDVIFARRDRIALVVADASGDGIVPGIVMAGLRALFHLVTNTTRSASTILDWVNKSIADGNIGVDCRAAVAYVLYSPETNEIEFAGAGSQPMLLWRAAERRLEAVGMESEPLGVGRNSEYAEKKLTAAPGDIIFLYTDGIAEMLKAQGERHGLDSLSRVIAESEGASARDIAAAVGRDLNGFMGPDALRDDQTLLVMKIGN